MCVWNCDATNVQRRIVWIRALQRQKTIRRHFAGLDSVVSLPRCLLQFGSAHRRLLGLFVRFDQPRLVVVVVPLQQLLTHRYELAQPTLHLLELLRVIDADVQLDAHRLDGTVITELALVRLLGAVS